MEDAYQLSLKFSRQQSLKQKEHYDRKVKSTQLLPGDQELLRSLSEWLEPGILRSHWEDQVYTVTKNISDESPVYEITPEDETGKTKVVHRNLLYPCDYIETRPQETIQKTRQKIKRTRPKSRQRTRLNVFRI